MNNVKETAVPVGPVGPIEERLREMSEQKLAAFQRKLLPTLRPEKILGVRTPLLRGLAKELDGTPEAARFLEQKPHALFEEDQLHAFLLCRRKDFAECLAGVDEFLPYIDNWATCDQMSPKAFYGERARLLEAVQRWLGSEKPYVKRYALNMLMTHFLEEDFQASFLQMAAEVKSGWSNGARDKAPDGDDYYIHMMQAWYFATALAKQWDLTVVFLQEERLDPWTHERTIRKAVESRRITEEQKAYLRTLRRHPGRGRAEKKEQEGLDQGKDQTGRP